MMRFVCISECVRERTETSLSIFTFQFQTDIMVSSESLQIDAPTKPCYGRTRVKLDWRPSLQQVVFSYVFVCVCVWQKVDHPSARLLARFFQVKARRADQNRSLMMCDFHWDSIDFLHRPMAPAAATQQVCRRSSTKNSRHIVRARRQAARTISDIGRLPRILEQRDAQSIGFLLLLDPCNVPPTII